MSVENFKDKYLKEEHLSDSELRKSKQAELEKEEYELEQIDNDKTGDDFVIQTEQAKEKAAKVLEDDLLSFLDEDKNYTSYRERLAAIGQIKLKSIEFEAGWEYFCVATRDGSKLKVGEYTLDTKPGVVVIIVTPNKKTYVGAMGVTYDPRIDHGALTTLVIQAENTYDKLRGYSLTDIQIPAPQSPQGFEKTQSGIYLPD